jgi:cytochrome P450
VFLELNEEVPNDGIIGMGALGHIRLLVTKPGPLADILVHHSYDFVKPTKVRNFLRRILGDGLIIVEGDRHRFLRKNSLPAFSFRHIKDLYPMMWSKSLLFTEYLDQDIQQQLHDQAASGGDLEKEGSGKAEVEINSWANKVTLDVIGIAGLGREFNVLKNSDDQLAQDYESILEPSREKFLFFIAATWISWRLVKLLPWKLNQQFAQRTSSIKSICDDLVKAKREAILKKGDDHFDILSLLIKSDNFSDEELTDQLLTYLAAG